MPTIVELLTASSVHVDAPRVDVTLALSNDSHVRAQRAGGSLRSSQSASALHIISGRETTGQSEVSTGLTIDVPPGTWVIVDRARGIHVACSPESIILADRRTSGR